MRVHLIKEKTIRNYVLNNASGHIPFEEWLSKITKADWDIPKDMQNTFKSADLLGKSSKRVVFDIGGNNFRMICKYTFGATEVHLFVCWIGTHAAYDKICAEQKQYSINIY